MDLEIRIIDALTAEAILALLGGTAAGAVMGLKVLPHFLWRAWSPPKESISW